jgi:hypothetical protein
MNNPLRMHRFLKHPLSLLVVTAIAVSACSHTRTHEQEDKGTATAPAGMATDARWRSHAEYSFPEGTNRITPGDADKASEIASYMLSNPTLRICLDGADPRRVGVVRDALIAAGVSPASIRIDPLGDPERRREDRVAVLVGN